MADDQNNNLELDALINEIRLWAESYARENGWKVNPDQRQLSAVVKGLARNKQKFGVQYCPCRIRSGDKEKDSEIVCPCIYHKNEIETDGNCHCQFFFK